MARITADSLTKIDKERNTVHDVVNGTYTVFEDHGKKYFQIDTFGRSGRKFTDKISQSIQLDAQTAADLIKIWAEELFK